MSFADSCRVVAMVTNNGAQLAPDWLQFRLQPLLLTVPSVKILSVLCEKMFAKCPVPGSE